MTEGGVGDEVWVLNYITKSVTKGIIKGYSNPNFRIILPPAKSIPFVFHHSHVFDVYEEAEVALVLEL